VSVPVIVRATDPSNIQVLDFSPSRIQVRLDPLVSKTVPVQVDHGTVPAGLDVREPVVSQDTVTVTGPESSVVLVAAAQARVQIQPSGIDINQAVDLIAVDARTTSSRRSSCSELRPRDDPDRQPAVHARPAGQPGGERQPGFLGGLTGVEAAPLLVTVEAGSALLAPS